ncbi:hypothetical protein [Acetivibrio cellulolyticus]|uniref:hypothetical protein n=1 Tax=Acetivibrio cellulolyticus TaxID=35830 RepID=UPI00058CD0A7|nr:hypothetical protein [Acetivibrio cellulolyticus]
MNSQRIRILIAAMAFIIIICVIAIFAALSMDKKKKSKKFKKQVYRSKGNDIWFSTYTYFSKFFLTKKYLRRIRKRIEMLEMSDNWTVSRKTMKFAAISFSAVFAMLVVLMLLDLNLYYFIISLITVVIVHNQIINMLVDGIEKKLIVQFDKFLGDVRHHYHEHGMIDEAVYDSINDCKYEMSIHATRMYEILTSDDPENEIEKYNELAPNKFFKTFIANCYTVQKFGDKIVDDESMFLTNLNYLKQEINLEMLRRQKLDYLFNSLSIIALAPIFTLKPLESWGKSNLPEMVDYFQGPYGFVVQIVLFLLVILSYKLINTLKSDYQHNEYDNGIYQRLLKIPVLAGFISILKNKQYNKALKYGDLLKSVGMNQRVEHFYLRRIIYLIAALFVCIFVFVNIHSISKHNILYTSESLMTDDKNTDKKAEEEMLKMDREIIQKYGNKRVDFKTVEKAVLEYGVIEDKTLAGIASKRIIEKLKKYREEYFKWWELLICLLIAVISYNIPYWLILFRKKVIQMNMEDEVMQYHAIILMLMHIDRVSVEDILKWMEQFAVVFKDSISKCLNNFENGDMEALEQLKIDEPFVPFSRIVENLQSASDKIPIVRAFDQLKVERGYYQEKRKMDNEITLNKKGMWGKMIAFVPLIATIFLYILLPFILISINQLMDYSSQMGNSI